MSDDVELEEVVALRECRAALADSEAAIASEIGRANAAWSQLAAAEARLAAAHATAASAEAATLRLTALLRTARQWHGHACDCLAVIVAHANDGTIDMEACDCGWRELAAALDAALAHGQPGAVQQVKGKTTMEDEESRYSDIIAGWPEAQRQVIARFLELRDARHEAERSAAYRAGVGVREWMQREATARAYVIITCPNCGADHTERGQLAAEITCSCGFAFTVQHTAPADAGAAGGSAGGVA